MRQTVSGAREMQRVIWMLWFQGWDAAPPIARACLASWRRHNPDWELVPLENDNLTQYVDLDYAVPTVCGKWLPAAAHSELVRVALLKRHGGVWVDGSVYCAKPLDEWLSSHMPAGFFAFDRPGPDRMLSSWFLATLASSPVVDGWLDAARTYWDARSTWHRYYWFHDLFAQIYDEHSEVRRIWDETPKISADHPHYFAPYQNKLLGVLTASDRERVESGRDLMYKLTHHLGGHRGPTGSVLHYFETQADPGGDAPGGPKGPRT